MHRKILMLAILVTCAVFGASVAGFAQSLNTFEEDDPEAAVDANATGSWVIEKNGEDAYPEMRDKRRASDDSHRYVNPRPELGCLYYDENDKRHWFPGCREL
jgi:hypothetical protein